MNRLELGADFGSTLDRAVAELSQFSRGFGQMLPLPFSYRSRGNTAIVGRHAPVFEQGRFKFKGWLAWLA